MQFRILGPLEVLENGHALDVGGSKQRALLAVLLLNANEVVSRDRLIDALWNEQPPETAHKALQVYVSQLRRVLGKDRLVTKAPGYLLRVDAGELDLARFETHFDGAREVEAEKAAAQLREALALWRGAPLAEFGYDSFAQSEIARLEELRIACLEERVDADLAAGRHTELVGELEGLVKEFPLRERLRSQLMIALYRCGRQAEALDAYQSARGVLVEELGIEPSKSLRELEQAILRQDPSLDLPATSAETPEAIEAERGSFVGRESELAEIADVVDRAIASRGGLVLLVGEPGIGKSRLADEATRHARARGARVLVGRCWEAGGAPAYWPWVQSLRSYIERHEAKKLRSELGSGAAEVAQIVPELRELIPGLPEPSRETEGARLRLFDSLTRFLKNAAVAQPILLVLDDLHAADEPSLLLLRFLAGELSSSRIVVVGTYRDVDPTVRDPLASTLAELAREQVTHRIELRGLTEVDVARYIELAAGRSPPAELVATIHAETEGNPLFVGEVVRLLAPEGRLAEVDVPILWSLGIPQGVREVIGRRLGRLSPACTRVLTLAAVLGREFALDALEKLSDLPEDEFFDVLDEALTARVLTSVPGMRDRLRFAHALIRETLYDALTTPRRVQLHRRAGQALELLYATNPEPHLAELAHHFFEGSAGGDVGPALAYAQRAGDSAATQLAYEEAARLYGLALQALDLTQPVNPVTRCDLLLRIGEALSKAGDTPEAKKTFLAAAELAREAELREHLANAALGYGGRFPWLRAGTDARLVPLLEEALAALGDEESILRVRLLARLAGALRDQPSLEPRSSTSQTAVEIARRVGDERTLSYALVSLGTATWTPDVAELLEVADEVSELAERTDDRERALQACWLHYIPALTLGDLDRCRKVAVLYEELADELKQRSQLWYGTVLRSHLAQFQGEFGEAEKLTEEALRLGERAQNWDAGFSYRIAMFGLRREQGRLPEIAELLRRSVDEYPGYRSFRCVVALLDCEVGREDAARNALAELSAADFEVLPRDSEWLFSLCILAEVATHLGEEAGATTLYDLLLPFHGLNAVDAGELAIGSVARYLGLVAATTSRWGDAETHFEAALEANARMGARPWLAHTQDDFARMLITRDAPGDAEKAQALLTEALTTYEELGMRAAAERVSTVTGAHANVGGR